MHFFLENPSWITQRCHLDIFSNFLLCYCLYKFYDVHLLRIRGKCITHRISQTWLSDTNHRSFYFHLIYFGKLSETITLSDAIVPAHTSLHCIFALWVLFIKILPFWMINFVTIFVTTFYFNKYFWNLDPLLHNSNKDDRFNRCD